MHLLLTRITNYPICLRSTETPRVQHVHSFNVTPSAQWPVIFILGETFFLFVKPIFKTLTNAGKILSYSWRIKPTRCHLLYFLYFSDTQHVSGINMSIFRSFRLCCWTTTLAVLFLDCCVLELGCGWASVVSGMQAAGSPDTTLAQPHPNSNIQQSKNNIANVVVHPEDGHINARSMLSI